MTSTFAALFTSMTLLTGGFALSIDPEHSQQEQAESRLNNAASVLLNNNAEAELLALASDQELGADVQFISAATTIEEVDGDSVQAAGNRIADAATKNHMSEWVKYVQIITPAANTDAIAEATREAMSGKEPGLDAARAQIAAAGL